MTTTKVVLGNRHWQVFARPEREGTRPTLMITPATVSRRADVPLTGDEPSDDTVVLEFTSLESLDYVIRRLEGLRRQFAETGEPTEI